MGVFVQIGAGAGDLDARAGFRDGFTEYVKKLDFGSVDKVILVEPNSVNIQKLLECWKDYPQCSIYQIGIRREKDLDVDLEFYYAEEDYPHFQVFSMIKDHVLKHYPCGTINSTFVKTVRLKEFIDHVVGTAVIDLLALDIEGIDADILLETDWKRVECEKLSFEYLHLGNKQNQVMAHLNACGFFHVGSGVDVNGYDLMFANKKFF